MRQIAGLLPLAAGRFSLDGAAPDAELPELCHYVGHLNAVKTSFSVRENLAFWAEFLGRATESLDRALAAFGLGALAELPAGLLSAGQKRKLALSRLFAASRPIWLLDEPHGLARRRFAQAARQGDRRIISPTAASRWWRATRRSR